MPCRCSPCTASHAVRLRWRATPGTDPGAVDRAQRSSAADSDRRGEERVIGRIDHPQPPCLERDHDPGQGIGAPRTTSHALVGALLVAYALLGYPLLGHAAGQHYPAVPTFGLPCPTTIFTFGLLAFAVRPPSWVLLVIPLAWAVIGTSAAASLRVPEDWGLTIASASVIALNLRRTAADRDRLRNLYE